MFEGGVGGAQTEDESARGREAGEGAAGGVGATQARARGELCCLCLFQRLTQQSLQGHTA